MLREQEQHLHHFGLDVNDAIGVLNCIESGTYNPITDLEISRHAPPRKWKGLYPRLDDKRPRRSPARDALEWLPGRVHEGFSCKPRQNLGKISGLQAAGRSICAGATSARRKSLRAKTFTTASLTLCLALFLAAQLQANAQDGGRIITIGEDRPSLNFVGQFINSGPNSHQFGYLSRIQGVMNVFNSSRVKDESTAMFTFSTYATNVQVVNNGPLRVVNRTGTTTIYYHLQGGASFSDPSSFEAGIPIQVSDYDQQVVLNPSVAFPFTTTHLNTITSTQSFVLEGELLRLGRDHDCWRTHYLGTTNTASTTPTGYFAGYAVRVSRDQN
jgi:hypothetical protein